MGQAARDEELIIDYRLLMIEKEGELVIDLGRLMSRRGMWPVAACQSSIIHHPSSIVLG
jgi:hypothetical protein